jgi:hypothetical protein
MSRHLWVTMALLGIVSPGAASLDRPKPLERVPVHLLVSSPPSIPNTTQVPTPDEAQLTNETEVYLDGRKCQYKDVPTTASITSLVLAEDGRTIIRIEFSAKR